MPPSYVRFREKASPPKLQHRLFFLGQDEKYRVCCIIPLTPQTQCMAMIQRVNHRITSFGAMENGR